MIPILKQSLQNEIQHGKLSTDLLKYIKNKHVASQSIEQLSQVLESFLLSMFDALEVVALLRKDPMCGRAVTFANAHVLQYVLDDDDLLSEQDYGVLGFLDDAYLVHRFTSLLCQTYAYVDTSKISYQAPNEHTLQIIRTLLPDGVSTALDMTSSNLIQVASAFFLNGSNASNRSSEPFNIRVDDAIELLGKQ